MKILMKYSLRSLWKNRVRTIVTLIGIILSMALLTAVIEGAYSGLVFLRKGVIAEEGGFSGIWVNWEKKDLPALVDSDEIKEYATWQEVGWADIGSKNEYKPYLVIKSISDNYTDLVSVHMKSGRLPENGQEIALPTHLATNGGVNSYAIGDTITLNVGDPPAGGNASSAKDSKSSAPSAVAEPVLKPIENTTSRSYTVVGFFNRLNSDAEPYDSPGYTALTKGEASGPMSVFFALKKPANFDAYSSLPSIQELQKSEHAGTLVAHSDLLRLYGLMKASFLAVIQGLAAFLVIIIVVGSVSLIYNSFSISLSERTQQIGMLRSIGATRKQVDRVLLFEALFLAGIGIPVGLGIGCLGIGTTFRLLRDSFSFLPSSQDLRIGLEIHPGLLALAALLCFATIVISAWIPRMRASRITPLEAIRQNRDVAIRKKDVRTRRITRALFGTEGVLAAKYFRRSRKKYRATIIALFISIVLFIVSSSLRLYMQKDIVQALDLSSTTDVSLDLQTQNLTAAQEASSSIAALPGVQDVARNEFIQTALWSFPQQLSPSYFELGDTHNLLASRKGDARRGSNGRIVFVDDASFRKMLQENGLEEAPYFDTKHPRAVAWNQIILFYVNDRGQGETIASNQRVFAEFPADVQVRESRKIDGYTLIGSLSQETDSQESRLFELYYPSEEAKKLPKGWNETQMDLLDQTKLIRVSQEDSMQNYTLEIAAEIRKAPFFLSKDSLALLYPESQRDQVLAWETFQPKNSCEIAIRTTNHEETARSIHELATSEWHSYSVTDLREHFNQIQGFVTVIQVFSLGFIILITLIVFANLFNTITVNILLRQRDFAMLRSIGMGPKSFRRMILYEGLIYGIKSLLYGIPVSILLSFLLYQIISLGFAPQTFLLPWSGIAVSAGTVCLIMAVTLAYSLHKIKQTNIVDVLKKESI